MAEVYDPINKNVNVDWDSLDEDTRKQILRQQSKKFKDVRLEESEDHVIRIPKGMDTQLAIQWLEKKRAQEEELMSPQIPIACFPFDGLVAFSKALRQMFGFATYKPIRSFFGDILPEFKSIPVGPDETIECPTGEICIPGIKNHLELGFGRHANRPCLIIGGEIQTKHLKIVKELAELTKQIVRKESIYRGKAIQLGVLRDELPRHRNGEIMTAVEAMHSMPPTFMRVEKKDDSDLVLSRILESQVRALLWTPIDNTAKCREARVPLKRGVLLEGPYGTGKSLCAAITMNKAVSNGWTFINLSDPNLLPAAIELASWYQPTVIFAEDVDSIIGTQDRTASVNAILNVVDGIDKSREIVVVLTTNDISKINRAMLRPGRLDAIIRFAPPDADATERLLRMYATQADKSCLIKHQDDISGPSKVIAGAPASMVREVVERAKLSAICRTGSANQLSPDDLYVAATAMKEHLLLMQSPKPNLCDPRVAAMGESLGSGFATGIARIINGNHDVADLLPVGMQIKPVQSVETDDAD